MKIHLKHIHPVYQIGLVDLRTAWLLLDTPVKLTVSVHQGMISYRMPKSGTRISYRQLKKGLVKTARIIHLPIEPLPF